VASLTGTDSESELGEGFLYSNLVEKLPELKRSHFFRWLGDEDRKPSVRSLNVWFNEEGYNNACVNPMY
jgi:hypothetical protein